MSGKPSNDLKNLRLWVTGFVLTKQGQMEGSMASFVANRNKRGLRSNLRLTFVATRVQYQVWSVTHHHAYEWKISNNLEVWDCGPSGLVLTKQGQIKLSLNLMSRLAFSITPQISNTIHNCCALRVEHAQCACCTKNNTREVARKKSMCCCKKVICLFIHHKFEVCKGRKKVWINVGKEKYDIWICTNIPMYTNQVRWLWDGREICACTIARYNWYP